MSRSIKHEKTTGFLERAGKIRKDRKAQRALKAELLMLDFSDEINMDYLNYAAG